MKILVLSDSHGDINKAAKVIKNNRNIDLIIHLGDYFRDALKLSSMFPNIPFEYIYGNCDFMIEDTPAEKILEYYGKKIFITHGHRYSVKWDYDKLYRKAEELGVDLLLFGHTHIPDVINRGRYFVINPGSISDPRENLNESYVIIELDKNKVKPEICFV